jgi:hypothetical protein
VCNACPVKSACTNSANGRTIRRPFDQAYIERVQRYHATGACQRAIRKRQACVEPLSAEAKTLHGLSRFRPRGIEKVNMEGLMVAAGQNLKRLFKYSGMRPAPLALAVLASALLALRRAFVPSAGSGPGRSAASPT